MGRNIRELEQRVTRLEELLLRLPPGEDAIVPWTADPLRYPADDPRVLFAGGYPAEKGHAGRQRRWFGATRTVQMIFPHGRHRAQQVVLEVRRQPAVDLSQLRVVVSEAPMEVQVNAGKDGYETIEFPLPAGNPASTEIFLLNVPSVYDANKDGGGNRRLSFQLYEACFTGIP
jgi:hypothetical protein